jgi:hypothetical protein
MIKQLPLNKLPLRFSCVCAALLSLSSPVSAAPHEFSEQDFIEYGIYFAAGSRGRGGKLLTVRSGDIKGYYAKFLPEVKAKDVPTLKQTLRLRTSKGSVIVNRDDNVGLTVIRDTWNEKKRTGTKRLDVKFENATCTDAAGVSAPCVADLVLTTDGADKGVVSERRRLTITTSTGLSFSYRTRRRDGGKPLTPADLRGPFISNYAWEWRPGVEG